MTLEENLIVATRAVPKLDPATAYGIASTAADPATAAKATAGFQTGAQLRSYIERNDTSVQTAIWSRLSPDERKLAQGAGYKEPQPKPAGKQKEGGLLPSVETITGKPAEGIGGILHALGAGARFVKHAYRAAADITETGRMRGQGGFSGETIGRTFTPSEWASAWDRTQGEEDTFSPVGLNALKGDKDALGQIPEDVRKNLPKLDDESLGIAKVMSAYHDNPNAALDALTQSVPPEDRAALVERVNTDPDLAKAKQFLDGQKYSVGRRIAHTVGLDPTTSGKVWTTVSGSTDAVWSWYGDPAISGLEAAKGINNARYLVRGADDVARLAEQPAVARHLEDVASHLASAAEERAAGEAGQSIGRLVERYPAYASVVDPLVQEDVTTAEGLSKWFQGSQGLTAILSGRVSGVADAVPLMPRTTALGAAKLDLKVAAKRTIDFAADMPKTGLGRLVVPVGKFTRRATTLIPKGFEFEASDPEAVTQLQRIASMALPAPRVRELVDAWVANPAQGARFGIYKGLLSEVFRAAGVDATTEGRQFVTNFMGKMDDMVGRRAYSVGDVDKVVINGKQASAGVLEGQLSDKWAMPSFKVLWAQSKRLSLMRGIYNMTGVNLTDLTDRFMQTAWKPTTLLRLGFPIRAGGEELVGAVMREGPLAIARGKLAAGLAQATEREYATGVPRVLPWNPMRGVWNRMSEHLPERVTDPVDAIAGYIGGRSAQAFRAVEGKLAGQEYVQGARELWDHGIMQGAFADELSAAHQRGAGYLADPDNAVRMTRNGDKMRPIYFRRTGAYREYAPTDGLYDQAWQDSLSEIANDRLARRVLEHAEGTRDEQVAAVMDTLESRSFAPSRERALRSKQTRDGRKVGVDATEEEALRDWANAVVDHVDAHTKTAGGEMAYPELASDLLAKRSGPSTSRIGDIPVDMRPAAVKGAEVAPVPVNAFGRFVDKGFAEVVGRPMDWMVRQPLFVHNYVLAKREVEGLRSVLMSGADQKAAGKVEAAASKAGERAYKEALKLDRPETMTEAAHLVRAGAARSLAVKEVRAGSDVAKAAANVEEQIRDVAVERAIKKTIPYIHDPELRSQMAVIGRNFAPFWFAQEQFYKRWAKVLSHSPEAFRQAQLLMGGLRHSGIIKQDENGDDYFIYPGVSVVQDVISKGIEAVTGEKVTLPLPASFSGHVKFATPGLERLGLPSFGPVVAVGVHALRSRFPEMAELEQTMLGERGAGRPYWEQVTPTTVARMWHAMADNPETSPQLSSAMMQAMQYLEASGNGLPENATAAEQEAYTDRVKNWTRTLFITRTLYGYSVPAAPELQLDPNDLNQEFRHLLSTLPIEEASTEFMRRHPDATAYTVFQSQAKAGTPLPATEETFSFMATHHDFLKSYPAAGGLFLPQVSPDSKYSQAAYREQLATGMRDRKTPKQFIDDVKYQQAADEYFRSRDIKDKALEAAKGTSKSAQIRNSWAAWKDTFFKAHPIFADQLTSSERQQRKDEALSEVRVALGDPRVPENAQTSAMRELVASFDNHQAFQLQWSGVNTNTATNRRKVEAKGFADWAEHYVADHPEVKPMFDRLMREAVD